MTKPSKNRRKFSVGFTLIELVIVIVVIGILALLVAVNFSGIVMKSKKAGFNVSAQSVLRAMQVKEAGEEGFDPLGLNETNIQSSLNITPNNFDSLTVYLYNNQDYVYIIGKNDYAGLTACGVRGNVSVELSEEASCALGGSAYNVAKTTDTTAGSFGGGDGSTCALAMTIDSIEDLVYFSNQVDGGNTYLNKCIKLAIDLDFNQSKSYVDPVAKTYGDINGNAVTEGLKTELTTGSGFNPIGSNTATFRGLFDGGLNTIYDLYINRPATSYVGLFSVIDNAGRVYGVNLTGVDVKGADYTGGLAGRDGYYAGMSQISVSGKVVGNNRVGLAAGAISVDFGTVNATSISVQGDVTGNDYVGGITGYYYVSYSDGNLIGINKGGTIIANGNNAGRITGYREYSHSNVVLSGLALSSITVKGSTITSSDNTSNDGASISNLSEAINNINTAEMAFDTYIGGDNDGDGYYWDYDGSGVVIQKKIVDNPITFTLTGAGSTGDPYIINNYSDLKQASTRLGSTYKLMSNIDMSSNRYYMLGSYPHPFTGKFDGNLMTISNLTIDTPKASYIGFSGYNKGTIQGLKLTNIYMIGSYYVGGITGVNDEATITEVSVQGNVAGGTFVSLAMGRANGATGTSIIVDGNITGTDYVGGIVGYNFVDYRSCKINGIYKNGNIIATGANVARISGSNYFSHSTINYSGLALSAIKINGSIVSSSDVNSTSGSSFGNYSEITSDINFAELALDTYIGGDSDNNGYYWDYDGGGTVIQKKVSDNPLTFTLSGAGTTSDPYLVNNYAELRQSSMKLSSTIKLMADIDMTGNKFYMFGSYPNAFTGKFDGNLKTISNIVINAPNASYIGFNGLNRGVIQGIKLTNINIMGNNYIAGISGYNDSSKISEVSAQGNVTGNNNVGMIVGRSNNATCVSVIAEGNVTGSDYIGGIVGYNFADYSSSTISGVNKGGSIVATGSNRGRISGRNDFSHSTIFLSGMSLSSTTVNGSTLTNKDNTNLNGQDFSNFSDITSNINTADMTLDTYIGGDNDNDGYYWDYDGGGIVVQKKIVDNPLNFALSGAGTTINPYLIYNYTDLKQATLRLGSTHKLMADVDMTGNRFYMFGGYMYPFTGKFDGGAKTVSNISINAPKASYIGFSGRNRGTIEGLSLTNINITGMNCVGGVAGYNEGASVKDMSIQGNVSGYDDIGLVVGFSNTGTVASVVVNGGVSGNDYIGGIVGYNYANYSSSYIASINKGGVITSVGGNIGRIVGINNLSHSSVTLSNEAVSTITLNGSTVTSASLSDKNGKDIVSGDLSVQSTYTNALFNFTDEALDYIWYMDAGVAKFREGSL